MGLDVEQGFSLPSTTAIQARHGCRLFEYVSPLFCGRSSQAASFLLWPRAGERFALFGSPYPQCRQFMVLESGPQ